MEATILSRQIENAQKKVEEQNFVARKNVLKYDDVMNVQRQVIYEQRNRVLARRRTCSEEIREEWLPEVISNVVAEYTSDELQRGVGSRRARRRDGDALRHRRHRRRAEGARPRGDRRRSSSTTRSTPTREREKEIEARSRKG